MLNVLNNDDVLKIFGTESIKSKKNIHHVGMLSRDFYNPQGLDYNLLEEILSFDIKLYLDKLTRISEVVYGKGTVPAAAFSKELRFCETCMNQGYHSIYHQLKTREYCHIHKNTRIKKKCPECKQIFSLYNLKQDRDKAFQCSCGYNFLSFYTIKDVMELFKKSDVRILNENLLSLNNYEVIKPKYLYEEQFTTTHHKIIENIYFETNLDDTLQKKIFEQKNRPFLAHHNVISTYKSKLPHKTNVNFTRDENLLDCYLHEIYMYSKTIYRAIKKHIINKIIPTDHSSCIKATFQNGVLNINCKYAQAFRMWREELEDVSLSVYPYGASRSISDDFESKLDRLSLYVKGSSVFEFLEILNNAYFKKLKKDTSWVFEIKFIINNVLPNLLIERFINLVELIESDSRQLNSRKATPYFYGIYKQRCLNLYTDKLITDKVSFNSPHVEKREVPYKSLLQMALKRMEI